MKLARKDLRDFFFRNRSYTPIPLVLAVLYFAGREGNLWFPGILLVLMGEGTRLWGIRYAGKRTRTRRVGAKVLCTSGPFGYVRNPLYLGNMLNYSGMVLMAGGEYVWVMLVITCLFFFLQYGLIISLEEETLTHIFGNQYLLYKKQVPRLLPRPTRWKEGKKTTPLTWRKVLQSEKRTFQTLLSFLIVLSIRIYLLV